MRHRRAAMAVVAPWLALVLTGCGQTGALYLPDAGGEVITRPAPAPAPAPAPPVPPEPST